MDTSLISELIPLATTIVRCIAICYICAKYTNRKSNKKYKFLKAVMKRL